MNVKEKNERKFSVHIDKLSPNDKNLSEDDNSSAKRSALSIEVTSPTRILDEPNKKDE